MLLLPPLPPPLPLPLPLPPPLPLPLPLPVLTRHSRPARLCERRYSEFHNFNVMLKERFGAIIPAHRLTLPGKKVVGRSDKVRLTGRGGAFGRLARHALVS